ncbi:MAG: hypothetical protein SNJ82_09590 [Gemmataceae bacterium]
MTLSSCVSFPSIFHVPAWAFRRVAIEEIAPLRKNPAPGHTFPISLLKNADEQTVVAVAALMQAVERFGQPLTFYRDWAVLAAPRFIGRDCIGQAIPEYTREGPWSVSPHIIPHRSLHSTSGTITLVLGSSGPNHGVGGGPDGETEGLLAALAMLAERPVPGVWLALSRVTPLQDCDCSLGRPRDGSLVEALVLALTREAPGQPLRLIPSSRSDGAADLDALHSFLQHGGTVPLARMGFLQAA